MTAEAAPTRRAHEAQDAFLGVRIHQRPLRVLIDGRLTSGFSGGVESVVIGLAASLSQLDDGQEEYLFLTNDGDDAWLRPFVSKAARLLPMPLDPTSPGRRSRFKHTVSKAFPPIATAWRLRHRFTHRIPGPPNSDGTIERVGADVMHFTWQDGFLTKVPSIYHPHDLQHLHLPQFFTTEEIRRRERWYRALCDQASLVAVASTWTKQDVEDHYQLPAGKVQVVPWAPPTSQYGPPTKGEIADAERRFNLPTAFVLYPAQTWPHKNHIGLVEALAFLRDRRDLVVPLVASGRQNEFFPDIERRVKALGMDDQVHWLGFVATRELQALYARARGVVVPSKFEAISGPVWEAFHAGVPTACSTVTSLPAQVGDAAVLFDPDRTEEMADAIQRLWTDDALRAQLIASGRRRVAAFSWDRTARIFRAHYRRLAGRSLSDEDQSLLASPPLL